MDLAAALYSAPSQIQALALQQAQTQNQQVQVQKGQLEIEAAKQTLADQAAARAAWQRAQTAVSPAAGGSPDSPAVNMPTGPGGSSPFQALDGMQDQMQKQMAFVSQLGQSGLFSQANEAFKGLMESASKYSTIQKNTVDMAGKAAETAFKRAEYANNLATGIRDPQTFAQAQLRFLSDNPGVPMPGWMSLPYDQAKPFIQQIQTSSKEGMAAAKTQSEIIKNRAAAAESAQLSKLNELRTSLEKMELEHQQERLAAARKAGQIAPSVKHEGKEGGQLTAMERTNADQMIGAANSMSTGFEEIMKLPLGTGMGTFADLAYSNEPSFIGGAKKFLSNKITSDESQMYASRLAGVNVAAAILASGGRAPRVSQMEAEKQATAELSGQSRLVAVDKIHQAALKGLNEMRRVRTGGDPELTNNNELAKQRLESIVEDTGNMLDKIKASKGTFRQPAAGTKTDVTQDEYNKLKPGQTYWYGGTQHTKE